MTDKINKYAEFMTKQVKEGSFGYPSKSGKQGVGVDSRGPVEDAVESLDENRKPRGMPIVGRTPQQQARMRASRTGAEGIQQTIADNKEKAEAQAEGGRNAQDNLKQDSVEKFEKKKNVASVISDVANGLHDFQKEHFKKWANKYDQSNNDGKTPAERHVITQDHRKNKEALANAYLSRYNGDFQGKVEDPKKVIPSGRFRGISMDDATDAAHGPLTKSATAIRRHIQLAKKASAEGDTERAEYNNSEARAHARHIQNNRSAANALIGTNKGNLKDIDSRVIGNQPARKPGLLARMFNAGQTHLTLNRRSNEGDSDAKRMISNDSAPSHSHNHDRHIAQQDSALAGLSKHLGTDEFHESEEVKFSDYVAWIAEGSNPADGLNLPKDKDGKTVNPWHTLSKTDAAEDLRRKTKMRKYNDALQKQREAGK